MPSEKKVPLAILLLLLTLTPLLLKGEPVPLTLTSPKPGIALAGLPLPIKWSISSGVPESACMKLAYSVEGGEWNEIDCFPLMSIVGSPDYTWSVPENLVGKSITIRGLLLSSCGGVIVSYGGDEVGPISVKKGFIVVTTNTTESRTEFELMGIS
ncbi:MAG: hypothetical protein DRO05_05655, partial [Thermoproteota archaeon]